MIKRSIIWLIVCVCSLFLLDNGYEFALKENLNIKVSYVLKKKIHADVLVLGSCEALSMANPDVIDSVSKFNTYNLATNHASISEQYLHLHAYLKNNKAPKVLLMHVSGENIDTRFNIFNGFRFAHLMDDPVVYQTMKEKDTIYTSLDWFPFATYAYYNDYFTFHALQGLRHYADNRAIPYSANGHEYADLDINFDINKITTNYPQGLYYQWDASEEKYLLKIFELAKANNIRLILYQHPVWKGAYAYLKNKKEMDARIQQLCAKNAIGYVQFENAEMSASKSNYITLLRLNRKNTYLFSVMLGKYIKPQ